MVVETLEQVGAMTGPPKLPVVTLRGVAIHALTEDQLLEHVVESIRGGRGGWIVTLNLQHLHRCDTDPSYRRLVDEADLVVADGMPLVWASRLKKRPLPQRVAGSDLVSTLSAAVGREKGSVFLLGGNPGAAEGAAEVLRQRCPGLRVAGVEVPAPGFERDVTRVGALRDAVIAARPDIVYVALGSPKQERLIRELRSECPPAWWIGIGISFSFLTGEVRRAPRWAQRLGLEWLHRFTQEPRRLFRRYVVEGLPFSLRLLWGEWRSRD